MTTTITIGKNTYGICEYGDRTGVPVFYFHGFSGSRIDGYLYDFDDLAMQQKIRIIAIDRPGIGLSSFQPGRTLLSWHEDVLAIASHLGIDKSTKFSILGISGGSPYALACAYTIPERLDSVTIVSGMGPFSYKESMKGMAMSLPKQNVIVRFIMGLGFMIGISKFPRLANAILKGPIAEVDLDYIRRPGKLKPLLECMKENFRQGLRGYLYDATLYRNEWGFKISDINMHVNLWHGHKDQNVSVELAKRISNELKSCTPTFYKEDGHFSLNGNHLWKILEDFTVSRQRAVIS